MNRVPTRTRSSWLVVAFLLTGTLLPSVETAAATLLWRCHFDEAVTGTVAAIDTGIAPPANGSFSGSAVRTTSAPGAFSAAAVSLQGAGGASHFVSGGDADKLDALSNMTITLWMNLRGTPAANDRILSKLFPSGTNATGFDVRFFNVTSASSFTIAFTEMREQPVIGIPSAVSATTGAATQWVFFAISYDGSRIRFWRGTETSAVLQVGTDINKPADFRVPSNTTADVRIGGTAATSADRTPSAWFDDVRIYGEGLAGDALEAIRTENIAAAPSIVRQPTSFAAIAGQDVQFDAATAGTPPLFHQWLFGTNAIAGATNTLLVLTNVNAGHAGHYALLVSNAYGTATSTAAQLSLPALAPLTVTAARPRPDRMSVLLQFNGMAADDATNVANYAIDGGVQVLAAALDSVTFTQVALATSLQVPYSNYTVSVTGLHTRFSGDPMATGVTAGVRGWGWYGPAYNVPESTNFTLLHSLVVPATADYNSAGAPYAIDHRAWLTNFARIAYYLELQPVDDGPAFVWVAMDAFSSDARKIGVPDATTGASFDQLVTNLNVLSSVAGIGTGTGMAGRILFTSASGGVMRVLGPTGQVLLAFDRWDGGPVQVGIGGASDATNFPIRRVIAYVKPGGSQPVEDAEVVVYGGTAGGVAAAVQAARMGKRAVLLCQDNHIGGLSSGGLGWTDIGGNGTAYIGGLAKEFYQRNGARYGQSIRYNLEPRVAESIFEDLLEEAGVRVFFNRRLAGVSMDGLRIAQIAMEDGSSFAGRMFIDTSYEGDLMAAAGVTYTVGREAGATYAESLAGVRTAGTGGYSVDPYSIPGDTNSPLLPLVHPDTLGATGSADAGVQAYNFRMAFSQTPSNIVPILPPAGYDAAQFELLRRYLNARVATDGGVSLNQMVTLDRPFATAKFDINNNAHISTDYIGASAAWPTNAPSQRDLQRLDHEAYTRGYFTYLATATGVPASVRTNMQTWGLCRDEFLDTGGWPHTLYVREARRMVSDYIMTQGNCASSRIATDGVGRAAYSMDSHLVNRVARGGLLQHEGGFYTGVPATYPVSYRSIVPRSGECENLFCTFALSASHVAFGSIRMEPVFMILSQSAGAAASLAIDDRVTVQQLDYRRLALQLLADGQVIGDVGDSPGIVVDNTDLTGVTTAGAWTASSASPGHWGDDYLHDGNANKGLLSVTYTPTLPAAADYRVAVRWTENANRATNTPIDFVVGGVTNTFLVNQRTNGGIWVTLQTTNLPAGTGASVIVRTDGTAGYVIADAVRFLDTSVPASTVSAVAGVPTAVEGGATARVSLVRLGDTGSEMPLAFTWTGSASNGVDFAVTPATVTLPAGMVATTLTLTALSDGAFEPTETAILTILPGTNYGVGALGVATVTVLNVDAPPSPDAQGSAVISNGFRFTFAAAHGAVYRVQRAEDPRQAWSNLAILTGTAISVQFHDTNNALPRAYYRTVTP